MRSEVAAFSDAAARLAERIAGSAVWSEGRCNWVGAPASERSRTTGQAAVAALGPDLYEGTSGIALFLAEAAARLDEPRLRATALSAIRLSLEQAGRLGRDGLHAGRLGVAYAASRVAHLHESEDVAAGATALLRGFRRDARPFVSDDVISGRAGSVLGLLALAAPPQEAARLGAELIERAERAPAGWSWRDARWPSVHNLCGYAHGASGVGHALAELFGATRDIRYRDAAERAFDYERSWLDPVTGTWPDLRGVERRAGRAAPLVPAAVTWCNGAGGIALARLRAHALLGTPALHHDAELALAACERHVTGLLARAPEDFCLCHGAAGAADVLLAGGRAELAAQVGRLGIEQYGRHGTPEFPGGVPGAQTPALMQGLAGIGLFYLRLADHRVASPLLVTLTGTSPGWESRYPGEGAKA
jgi:lantibiotic modifying enzyme